MYLLLQDGGHFLLEDGSRLALEDGIVPSLLLENGEHLLLQDGGRLLLEEAESPTPVITQTSSGGGYKGRYRKTVFDDPIEKEKTIEVKLYKDFKVIKAHVWDKSSSISRVIADNFRPTQIISAQINAKVLTLLLLYVIVPELILLFVFTLVLVFTLLLLFVIVPVLTLLLLYVIVPELTLLLFIVCVPLFTL